MYVYDPPEMMMVNPGLSVWIDDDDDELMRWKKRDHDERKMMRGEQMVLIRKEQKNAAEKKCGGGKKNGDTETKIAPSQKKKMSQVRNYWSEAPHNCAFLLIEHW